MQMNTSYIYRTGTALLLLLAAAAGAPAQERWSLKQCIDHAIANNITIRQTANQAEQSRVDVNTAKWAAPLYKLLLRMGKEDDSCVRELLSIKSCGVSIEQFERMMRQTGSEVIDKIYWFINPHYKRKFGFTPKKLYGWVGKLKYLRNYFCTSCFYLSR